jgi:hypothetical protein
MFQPVSNYRPVENSASVEGYGLDGPLAKTLMRKELIMRAHSTLIVCILALTVISALCVWPVVAQEKEIVRLSGSRYAYYVVMDLARLRETSDGGEVVQSDTAMSNLTKTHAAMAFGDLDEDRAQEAWKRVRLVKHTLGTGAWPDRPPRESRRLAHRRSGQEDLFRGIH